MHEIGRRKPSQPLLWTALCWTLGLFPTLAPLPAEGQARPNEPDLSVVRSALTKYEDPSKSPAMRC